MTVGAYRECLSRPCLPIGKYSAIEPAKEALDQRLNALPEEGRARSSALSLAIDVIKGKAPEVVPHHRHLLTTRSSSAL